MGRTSKKPTSQCPGPGGMEEADALAPNLTYHWFDQSEASTSGQGPQVYQRRRKMVSLQTENREGLRQDIQLATGPDAGIRVSRPSWVQRALCGRRHSVVLERNILPSSETIFDDENDSDAESDSAPITPDVVERPRMRKPQHKPLAPLPADFVQEKLAYFRNVEAYTLEEESPQPDADQRSPQFVSEAEDDVISVGRVEYVQTRGWRALEAVAEEEAVEVFEKEERKSDVESLKGEAERSNAKTGGAETTDSTGVDARSNEHVQAGALRDDPQVANPSVEQQRCSGIDEVAPTAGGPQQSVASERVQCTEGVVSAEVETDGIAKKRTDESVRRLVFDEIPPNVPRGRRTSPAELAQARGKEKAHLVKMAIADVSEGADVSHGDDLTKALRKLSLTENVATVEKSADCVGKIEFDAARRVSRRRSSLAKQWKVAKEPETPLQAMLRACGQESMPSLNNFISNFYPVKKLSKLGEGTFGEAFKAGDMCFKIVPMGSDVMVNGDAQKTVEEMYSEVLLTNAITSVRFGPDAEALPDNASDTFIQTYGVGICSGAYSQELTAAWEAWHRENTSENDHPRIFQEDQAYVVFAFADGGSDLEHFVLRSYVEAVSLLLQVAAALAAAEQGCKFEHRDLHWGNILLARRGQEEVHMRLNGQSLRMRAHGISVALIDFTLSRLDTEARVLFCDLTPDTWLFEGPKGDVQADTYRRMKRATSGCWEGSYPATNVFWIHYLADILLNKKSFTCSLKEKHALRGFRKRTLSYKYAGDILQDALFEDFWC